MIQDKSTSGFINAIIVGILILCLCLALLYFVNSANSFNFEIITSSSLLLPAILLQVFALFLFVLGWKLLLAMQEEVKFGLGECTAHIGVTLMGKYLPGKIWGLLGRSYLLTRRGRSKSEAVSLLLADQILTFYAGFAIGGIALLVFFSINIALLASILLIVLSPFFIRYYEPCIHWLLAKTHFFLKRISQSFEPAGVSIDKSLLGLSLCTYSLHWLITALVLSLLYYPFIAEEPLQNIALIVAAIPLGVLTGFVAMWAPGGIGVREAVIISILALNLPLDLAASIALTYRLICIINDLSTGCFALFYYGRNHPDLWREDS